MAIAAAATGEFSRRAQQSIWHISADLDRHGLVQHEHGRILRQRRHVSLSGVRRRRRHMVQWPGSDGVPQRRLSSRLVFHRRNVWPVNDILHPESIRSAFVVQLLPQQRRLQHLGQSDRPTAQVRRVLSGSTAQYVHASHARRHVENGRASHAKFRFEKLRI